MSQRLCIITGGNRGFGRAAAVALARHFAADPIVLVLIARSLEHLEETRALVLCEHASAKIILVDGDLGKILTFEDIFARTFANVPSGPYAEAILVNNVGSLGDLSVACRDVVEPQALQAYFDLNVTSVIALTSRFLRETASVAAIKIVNISSLLAVKAFPGWHMYASGKAARDMYHATVAEEEKNRCLVLNYAPGPLDTEMQAVVRHTIKYEDQRAAFTNMHTTNTLVDPAASARVLIHLLYSSEFPSGSHLDFYDFKHQLEAP